MCVTQIHGLPLMLSARHDMLHIFFSQLIRATYIISLWATPRKIHSLVRTMIESATPQEFRTYIFLNSPEFYSRVVGLFSKGSLL